MPHPHLRSPRTRALAALGVTGVLLTTAAPVAALGGAVEDPAAEVCTELLAATGLCEVVGEVVGEAVGASAEAVAPVADALGPLTDPLAPVTDPVTDALTPVTDPVTDALAPVTGPLAPVTDPVTDALAPATDPVAPGGPAPAPAGGAAAPAPSQDGSDPTKVEAAGKDVTEVAEPQAPPAADGRVAGGPTLQPLDLGALGANMAGVRSQTGVTLQPYDAPLVSVPGDAPQVASLPVTTASPAAALASEAIDFTGAAVLPHTTGSAAWVTATGLGLLAGTAVMWRRRLGALSAETL